MSALPLNQVFEFDFSVHNPAATNGPLVNADSTPTYDVYEQGSRTPILAAQNATNDTTGVYYGSITCSAANGFDVGKTYQIKATAIVGGVTDKLVVSRFRIVAAETTVGVPRVDNGVAPADIAAIKAKTDNLPTDPADASDIAGSFTTVNTKLDTIDDFLDTEVAAIKAKTDTLPASPAAVGSAMTLTSAERDATATAFFKLDWTTITGEAARSLLNAARFLRNRWRIVGGTLTVYKEDDAASAWTAPVTQTAGNPVSEIDPT
jgi:hypothetical protein